MIIDETTYYFCIYNTLLPYRNLGLSLIHILDVYKRQGYDSIAFNGLIIGCYNRQCRFEIGETFFVFESLTDGLAYRTRAAKIVRATTSLRG